MSSALREYEIRCPVHGFIKISDWERDIIAQPAFQRLRRIRQLAWTDLVYPGAMHTRFEHSLGVMHMATLLYDGLVERSRDMLREHLALNEDGIRRHRQLVRLAALLHAVAMHHFPTPARNFFRSMRGALGSGTSTIPPRSFGSVSPTSSRTIG